MSSNGAMDESTSIWDSHHSDKPPTTATQMRRVRMSDGLACIEVIELCTDLRTVRVMKDNEK
jgi:hypothetical protein